jgi:DNA-binding LytR/AlgR family response regulator
MYIAIVDDNKNDAAKAKELVQKHLSGKLDQHTPVIFDMFSSAEDFLQHFVPGHYTIVILDIYMYEVNGMEAAQKVASLDKDCHIIFLTTSTEHLLAGYTVHAAGYVLKPLAENKKQLCQAIDYCLTEMESSAAALIVHVDNVPVSIQLQEIFYVDCQNSRFALLHLATKILKTANTYQECLEQLQKSNNFLECYHRLLVNMKQIKTMGEDVFLLKNGKVLPISRRKKNEVKQAYLTYLSEH